MIIQARMGSSRLPGKVLRCIGHKPLLAHILDRLGRLRHESSLVVATTVQTADDAIAEFCRARRTHYFRGSEGNVLERFYQCAVSNEFDQIVRLTADNPFTDVDELDRLIDLHLRAGADFSHSFPVLPIGVGAEIFTFKALAETMRCSSEQHHFEHVDEYLLENPDRFETVVLDVSEDKRRPDVRLTVDDEADYRRANRIVELYGEFPSTQQAIAACSQFA